MKINFFYKKYYVACIILTCLFSATTLISGSSKDEEDDDNFLDDYVNEEVRNSHKNKKDKPQNKLSDNNEKDVNQSFRWDRIQQIIVKNKETIIKSVVIGLGSLYFIHSNIKLRKRIEGVEKIMESKKNIPQLALMQKEIKSVKKEINILRDIVIKLDPPASGPRCLIL